MNVMSNDLNGHTIHQLQALLDRFNKSSGYKFHINYTFFLLKGKLLSENK